MKPDIKHQLPVILAVLAILAGPPTMIGLTEEAKKSAPESNTIIQTFAQTADNPVSVERQVHEFEERNNLVLVGYIKVDERTDDSPFRTLEDRPVSPRKVAIFRKK